MTVKLLIELHLEFLSLKGGCTGSSLSTLAKMPHCWKSHVATHMLYKIDMICIIISLAYTLRVAVYDVSEKRCPCPEALR